MLETERAERLWLALAVSTLWVVGIGVQAEVSRPSSQREHLPTTHIACRTAGSGTTRPRGRELSCVTRGRLGLLAAVWHDESWPPAALWPEPWPEQFAAVRLLPAAQEHRRQKERERQRVKRRKHRAARRKSKRNEKRSA